jgi:hypothetical protein
MSEDPIVSEVRQVREQLARQFNFDVHAIFDDLRRRQLQAGPRLVRRQRPTKAEQAAAPAHDSTSLHPGR